MVCSESINVFILVGNVKYRVEMTDSTIKVNGKKALSVCDHRGRRIIISHHVRGMKLDQILKAAAEKIRKKHINHLGHSSTLGQIDDMHQIYWLK